MYYQNYEDYMRNVLGRNYTPENMMNYESQSYPYNYYIPTYRNNQTQNTDKDTNIIKLKKMYPEIYNILKPMVEKIVEENKLKEITQELIETMTKKIYETVEDDMTVRQVSSNSINDGKIRNLNSAQITTSNIKQPARKSGNPTLKDLIRILIINRILENILGNRSNEPFKAPNIGPAFPSERPEMRPPMMHGPMPRMSYPVMNYFNTPYPEDEYLG